MDNRFEGILIDLEIKSPKCAYLILEKDVKDKAGVVVKKCYVFKCLGEQKANEAKYVYDNYKGCLLKVVFLLLNDEKAISNAGNEYWREGGKMVLNIETAGKEPEQADELPDKEYEGDRDNNSMDLPF